MLECLTRVPEERSEGTDGWDLLDPTDHEIQRPNQKPRNDARTPVADEEEPRRISITFTHSTLCQTIRFIEHVRSAINRALFDISIRYDWFDSNNYFSTVKHN